jgi:hypothetical protein
MTAVGRHDEASSRWYIDPADPTLAYESVTTILSNAHDKPWLAPWAAKLAAEYAVDHVYDVADLAAALGRDAAVKLLKEIAATLRNLKADTGSYVHEVIEALILGGEIPDIPEHLDGVQIDGETLDVGAIVDGFLAWRHDHQPVFEMAEATVANPMHGYAGTLDAVAWFPKMRKRYLIDFKTGKVLDQAMPAQLSAYRNASEVWVDRLGNKTTMPQVDGTAILHLRPEFRSGYRFREIPAGPAEFAWFISCLRQLKHQRSQPKVMGTPLYVPLPDGSQPPIRVEDIDLDGFGRARTALVKAGVEDIAALAAMTEDGCLSLKGVGPACLDACRDALAAYGYQFTQPDDLKDVA